MHETVKNSSCGAIGHEGGEAEEIGVSTSRDIKTHDNDPLERSFGGHSCRRCAVFLRGLNEIQALTFSTFEGTDGLHHIIVYFLHYSAQSAA